MGTRLLLLYNLVFILPFIFIGLGLLLLILLIQ